jgi:hypothetical protein
MVPIDLKREGMKKIILKNVFDMTLLHPRATLLQNSRVEQLCSGVSNVCFARKLHSTLD